MAIQLRNAELGLGASAEEAGFKRTAMQRAITAGMRSPILDLEDVPFPQEDFSEGTMWLLDSTWIIPMLVRPFLKTYLASVSMGAPVKFAPEAAYGSSSPWTLADRGGLNGVKAHADRIAQVQQHKDKTRIKRTPKGFDLSLCVGEFDIADTAFDEHTNTELVYGKSWHEHALGALDREDPGYYAKRDEAFLKARRVMHENMFKLLGKDSLIPEKALDIRLPIKDVFANNAAANDLLFRQLYESWYGPDDLEGFDAFAAFKASVKSIRLVSTPTSARASLKINERSEDGTTFIEIDSAESALQALKTKGREQLYWRWFEKVQRQRDWYVYLDCSLDLEDAAAMVQSTNPKDITPIDIADWVLQWYQYQESKENVWKVRRLKDVEAANRTFAAAGIQPRTRMNEDRLTLHPEGYLMLIPEANNLAQYESTMSQNVDIEDGELSYKNVKYNHLRHHETFVGEEYVESRKNKEGPANRLLFVDWYNNKMSYTNTNGIQTTLDLERCVPINETHIRRILDTKLKGGKDTEQEDQTWAMITTGCKRLKAGGTDLWALYLSAGEDPTEKFLAANRKLASEFTQLIDSGDVRQSFNILVHHIENIKRNFVSGLSAEDFEKQYPRLDELSDIIKLQECDAKTGLPFFKGFGAMMVQAASQVLSIGDDIIRERSVITGLRELGFYTIIKKYLSDYTAIAKKDAQMRSAYTNPKMLGKDYVPKDIPLVAGPLTETGMQPHQARISDGLTNSPQYAVLRVQAGGGKTIQVLTNVLYELQKGNVKRPLILCPAHLVRDYVKEANFVTQGRLNMICLNTESVNSWGEEELLKLVANAPINTIVVTDYDFLKNRMMRVSYGREQLAISLNCELLRQMDFDGAWLDESHMLRKVNIRSVSCGRLLAEIPFKRIATGTLLIDQLTDVANQFAVFDPTVFGTAERFIEKYAQQVSGGKVMKWKAGAEREVMKLMEQYAMVLTANRREWASLLPPRKEKLYFVELSEAQRAVYESILAETLQKIAAEDPELYKLLLSNVGEDDADSLEGLLGPYLARLEQYLTSPGLDDAAIALTEEDKISAKATQIAKLCREHIDNNIPGKILIFTSFKASAKTIYEQLPPDLQDMCIHYKAAEKFKCAEEFERNPNKKIMVGVEVSMNTGLNLQMASRLIRVESVWSPGLLEQGESRINRPKLKGKDLRTALYFDWVIVNKTIDITKMGRLIGKLVSSVKFENPYEPAYQNLEVPPLVSMNLDSLRNNNDVGETLKDHLSAFYNLRDVQDKDYTEYRTNPKIDKTFKPVQPGSVLPGSALLKSVPYVSGMDLFGSEDLGLVKYHEYILTDHHAEADPRGLMIHTELGDGEITGMSKNKLRVKLNSGDKCSVAKMAAFIITRDKVSTKTIRNQLAKLAGLKSADPTELEGDGDRATTVQPEMVKPGKSKVVVKNAEVVEETPPKKTKPKKTVADEPVPAGEADGDIELSLGMVNGGWCINTDGEDPDAEFSTLKKHGFILWDKAYWYLQIETAAQMRTAIDKMAAKFNVPKQYLADLEATYELFSHGKSQLLHPQAATRAEFKNFFMERKRKPENADTIRPYILISAYDGAPECYIIVDALNTPAAAQLKSAARVPGTVWTKDTNRWLARYCTTHDEVKQVVKEMIDDGVVVSNLDDFKAAWKDIEPRRRATKKS